MSDAPQGPGWWQASDGRWYPPEQAPAPPGTPEWYGGGPVGPAPPRNDGLAVAALACAIAGVPIGFVCGVGFFLPVAAIPMGFVARRRIRESGGALTGAGMALAAIIIGFVVLVLLVLVVLLIVAFLANFGGNDSDL